MPGRTQNPPDQTRSGPGVTMTPLGGPTVVIDVGGLRLIVDPTFDPPGEYPIGTRALVKTAPAAWTPAQVGPVAAVLLSHDQHPDNLDRRGREFLAGAPIVLTTALAAARLGGTARALESWSTVQLARPDGRTLSVTGVPARHGPVGTELATGPVTGFVLSADDLPTIYVSGDNASLDIVRTIAARFPFVEVAVLFAGAAKTPLLGEALLTLSSARAVEAVRILGCPRVLPVHTDGWSHFTENGAVLHRAFVDADLADVLMPSTPGFTVGVCASTTCVLTVSATARR